MDICKNLQKYGVLFIIITTMATSLTACGGNIAPAVEAAPTSSAVPVIEAIEPLALDEALPPMALAIPDINLEVPVVAMGWRVAEVDGTRTTEWEVPYLEAGWHVNSAGAGAAGNTIISGHQVTGEAIFAPLALGEVAEGQEIVLTDEAGVAFSYRVVTVTEPIPATGATAEEKALAASYLEPADAPQVTLMTGWPDFTTTHYLFVVADFVGLRK